MGLSIEESSLLKPTPSMTLKRMKIVLQLYMYPAVSHSARLSSSYIFVVYFGVRRFVLLHTKTSHSYYSIRAASVSFST